MKATLAIQLGKQDSYVGTFSKTKVPKACPWLMRAGSSKDDRRDVGAACHTACCEIKDVSYSRGKRCSLRWAGGRAQSFLLGGEFREGKSMVRPSRETAYKRNVWLKVTRLSSDTQLGAWAGD